MTEIKNLVFFSGYTFDAISNLENSSCFLLCVGGLKDATGPTRSVCSDPFRGNLRDQWFISCVRPALTLDIIMPYTSGLCWLLLRIATQCPVQRKK